MQAPLAAQASDHRSGTTATTSEANRVPRGTPLSGSATNAVGRAGAGVSGVTIATNPAPPAIAADSHAEPTDALVYLPIAAIQPNPHQPRQVFDQVSLQQLAESIKSEGLIQPIVVRPFGGKSAGGNMDGTPGATSGGAVKTSYEIVAGERRWRAAKLAGLERIPSVIRKLSDRQVAEWALVENLQREDLNPMDRAEAFDRLVRQFHMEQDAIAGRLGIDRSSVSNHLRLLTLDKAVQDLVRKSQLSMGQAKVLAGVIDSGKQRYLALRAISQAWSVRQLEAGARMATGARAGEAGSDTPNPTDLDLAGEGADASGGKGRAARPAHFKDLEEQMSKQLGTKIAIAASRRKGAGRLTIEFRSVEHFDELLRRLGVEVEV